ncbi:NADH-ubiquinone oxidoreductase subunit NDUFA12 family protein [Acetobacter sp. DsW_063]|uniref:NADH-ubiquinone oxidoreductase subunit NDUFA12 family protein n=1 Tax=Acetobacter sp. DsW_063 TaxID=1514894 RepID=UPI000A36BEA7|nr:NADH-ubiquinone oxidoreductase subunit NDUFA12 family protein [Acetobacter sp. DsW_063]OUJ15413.1 NADH dehydrogenase [Acetobacter sp. DsW_063]
MTTLGTLLHTRLKGRLVGKDVDGRSYYQSRTPSRIGGGEQRFERWVIYHKGEDASAVPPEWWNWLHHVEADPIPQEARKPWQLPPQPNLTGTPGAYRPAGSAYRGGQRPAATGDYEAWTPDA